MKVHNDLKELLEDFSWFTKLNRLYTKEHINKMIIDFDSSNSLALGKPEPLAKNKQCVEDCRYKTNTMTLDENISYCKKCGGYHR